MKKFKKLFAMLLTLAMVMGMSVTTFAAPGDTPKDTDTTEAKVLNVEKGAIVTAYRIVMPKYTENGVTGYEVVKKDGTPVVTIADPLHPTSQEITTIAKDSIALANLEKVTSEGVSSIENGFMPSEPHAVGATPNPNVDGKVDFTAKLKAGYWLVIVKGTNDVYNPMLLGVYYSKSGSDNTMTGDPVNSNDSWNLTADNVYVKSTKPTLEKTIVNADGTTAENNKVNNGGDVAIGDIVKFQVDTVIPSYSKEYSAKVDENTLVVKITDQLSKGLTLLNEENNPIKVSINGVAITDATNVYTLTLGKTSEGEDTLEISFKPEYVLANTDAIRNVTVTYSARLDDDAGLNFVPNTNKAQLEYTNSPNNETTAKTKEEDGTTYTYTFGIGAYLNGNSQITDLLTKEIVKVDQNNKVISTVTEVTGNTEVVEVLTGATFTMTSEDGKIVKTGTTDVEGRLSITGLDAGKYTLVETVAPEGFQLDTTPHEVVISAKYNEDGTLDSYAVTIDGKNTNEYKATYENKAITKVEQIQTTEVLIKNTKLASLPSTGGIGTTIFTIGGCAIMILAAGLYFASRRKSAK